MPRRMLTSDIWAHEDFGQLSHSCRLFYIGLITNADDDGRLKASPAFLRAKIFPYDNSVTDEDVKTWRDECHDLGLIYIYNENSIDCLVLLGWFRNQQIRKDRYRKSQLPAPPTPILELMQQPSDIHQSTNGLPTDDHLDDTGSRSLVESSIVKSSIDNSANPFKFWSDNFELITPHTSNIVNDWIDRYGEKTVLKAMIEMKEYGKRSLRYCEKILLNWENGGAKNRRKKSDQATPRKIIYTED